MAVSKEPEVTACYALTYSILWGQTQHTNWQKLKQSLEIHHQPLQCSAKKWSYYLAVFCTGIYKVIQYHLPKSCPFTLTCSLDFIQLPLSFSLLTHSLALEPVGFHQLVGAETRSLGGSSWVALVTSSNWISPSAHVKIIETQRKGCPEQRLEGEENEKQQLNVKTNPGATVHNGNQKTKERITECHRMIVFLVWL